MKRFIYNVKWNQLGNKRILLLDQEILHKCVGISFFAAVKQQTISVLLDYFKTYQKTFQKQKRNGDAYNNMISCR